MLLGSLPGIKQLNDTLKGAPEDMLTVLLIGLAIIAIVTAIFAPPAFKAAVIAWFSLP
jgi:hypothetical protein